MKIRPPRAPPTPGRPDNKPLVWFGIVVVVVTIVVSLAGAHFAIQREAKRRADWLAFRDTHRCKAVAHKDGETRTAVTYEAKGSNTVTTFTTPARTGWLCDDGITRFVDDG